MGRWHGYAQAPDALPERPWWSRVAFNEARRSDGKKVISSNYFQYNMAPALASMDPRPISAWGAPVRDHASGRLYFPTLEEAIAHVDREWPLEAPEPLPGQVWYWPARMIYSSIVHAAHTIEGGRWEVRWGSGAAHEVARDVQSWPPPGAMLVSGEGAPWGPA